MCGAFATALSDHRLRLQFRRQLIRALLRRDPIEEIFMNGTCGRVSLIDINIY